MRERSLRSWFALLTVALAAAFQTSCESCSFSFQRHRTIEIHTDVSATDAPSSDEIELLVCSSTDGECSSTGVDRRSTSAAVAVFEVYEAAEPDGCIACAYPGYQIEASAPGCETIQHRVERDPAGRDDDASPIILKLDCGYADMEDV